MRMTPDEFFISFVYGNYSDFEEKPDCVRRGFNAAIAASHMADHCFEYFQKKKSKKVRRFNNIGAYVDYVSNKTEGYFKDIRSIANAFKHLYTKGPHASIASTGSIEAVTLARGEVLEVAYEYKEEANRLTVIFTRKTGEKFELLPILAKIIDFWPKEISSFKDDNS